jgi:hypothetical protein
MGRPSELLERLGPSLEALSGVRGLPRETPWRQSLVGRLLAAGQLGVRGSAGREEVCRLVTEP